MKHEVLAN